MQVPPDPLGLAEQVADEGVQEGDPLGLVLDPGSVRVSEGHKLEVLELVAVGVCVSAAGYETVHVSVAVGSRVDGVQLGVPVLRPGSLLVAVR